MKMKRMVTDPKTGERTAIVTVEGSGRVVWTRTKEEMDDLDRAQIKSARKNRDRNELKRAAT